MRQLSLNSRRKCATSVYCIAMMTDEFELQTSCQFFKLKSLNIVVLIKFHKIFRPQKYITEDYLFIYIEADDGDRSAPWQFLIILIFYVSYIGRCTEIKIHHLVTALILASVISYNCSHLITFMATVISVRIGGRGAGRRTGTTY